MLSKINLENILFLDIETVPEVQHFSDLDEAKQELWEQKSKYQRKDDGCCVIGKILSFLLEMKNINLPQTK